MGVGGAEFRGSPRFLMFPMLWCHQSIPRWHPHYPNCTYIRIVLARGQKVDSGQRPNY